MKVRRSCHRNWRPPTSTEFHGIPWNHSCHRNWETPSCNWVRTILCYFQWYSEDLIVSSKSDHFKFHGIPWWFWNWETQILKWFHGMLCYLQFFFVTPLVPWNSMLLNLPRNICCSRDEISVVMRLLVSSKLGKSKSRGIAWTLFLQLHVTIGIIGIPILWFG